MTREMNVFKFFLFFGIGVLATLLVGLLAYGCVHDAQLFFIYGKHRMGAFRRIEEPTTFKSNSYFESLNFIFVNLESDDLLFRVDIFDQETGECVVSETTNFPDAHAFSIRGKGFIKDPIYSIALESSDVSSVKTTETPFAGTGYSLNFLRKETFPHPIKKLSFCTLSIYKSMASLKNLRHDRVYRVEIKDLTGAKLYDAGFWAPYFCGF